MRGDIVFRMAEYQDLAYKLIEALQESIRLDLTGVEEREVR